MRARQIFLHPQLLPTGGSGCGHGRLHAPLCPPAFSRISPFVFSHHIVCDLPQMPLVYASAVVEGHREWQRRCDSYY